MQQLFPSAPYFAEEHLVQRPSHEWTVPALPRKNHYGIVNKLPSGKPDSLHIEILHFEEGIERCTAAVFGARAYVIHYEFTAHSRRKG